MVPQNIVVPFVGVEFDPTRSSSGPRAMPIKALILGQKVSSGTMDEEKTYRVFSEKEVSKFAGRGSNLHMMAKRWFSRNTFTEVQIIAVPEADGATATTFSFSVSGTSTRQGEQQIYIDQEKISVGVGLGESFSVVGARLVSAINASAERGNIGFTASGIISGTDYDITITSASKGAITGKSVISFLYRDSDGFVPGLTFTEIVKVAGSGTSDISDSITSISEDWFNLFVSPFSDTTNLGKMEVELNSRFGVMRQIDGLCIFGYSDTVANTITFSTTDRNSPHMICVDAYGYPQNPDYVATLVGAEIIKSVESDAGKPLHRIDIDNLDKPVSSNRRNLEELNALTLNGVFTLTPYESNVQTFGTVTMFLKDTSGTLSDAYRYVNTLYILMFLRYDFVSRIKSKYPRARLADSAEKIKSGISVITPTNGRVEAISIARGWETLGLVENIAQFENDIICRRSPTNKNRLEWILPPDLINQFIVGSGELAFIL
jgi:phage tail sheath gpL-like